MSKRNKNRLSKKDKRRIKKAVLAAAKKSDLPPNDLAARLTYAFRKANSGFLPASECGDAGCENGPIR